VLVERLTDFGDRRAVDVIADPDAVDFGAAGSGDRTHFNAAVTHPSCSFKIPRGKIPDGTCCGLRPGASGYETWLRVSLI
jgi:hypothetical protein